MADFDALSRLIRKADAVAESASVLVSRTLREIRGELANLAEELNLAGSAKDREKVYADIRRRMAALSRRMDRLMSAQNELAAETAAKQVSAMTGLEVKYSAKRAEAITELVTPAQGENLAAVFTQRMAADLIRTLQAATVAVLREQAIEGGTMKEMTRRLAQKWREAAKVSDPRFTDASGRTWDTATYLTMNVRTNTMRVYNDCLLDDIARATGSDIARISKGGGDPHCVCAAWEGAIISISGKTKGLPTYEQARNGGCFHPNCIHTLEYVDEDADAEEIELQKAHPVTKGLEDDPDVQKERRYEIDQHRYRNRGMTKDAARLAVDRDNLTDAIRTGLIREDARELVGKLTDAQVSALVKDGVPPRFMPTKKATKKDPHAADEKWIHGKRGGVVHIARDADAAKLIEVCNIKDAKNEWKPQTDLEKKTDALMQSIGAKHTDEKLDISGVNPNYSKGGGYTINCQRCVPTYEARCRGYDVEALSKYSGDILDGIAYGDAEWLFPTFKNPQTYQYKKRADIEKQMAQWGDGARAQIVCIWQKRGAHTFLAVQENGKTRFIDPQINSEDCSSHFSLIGYRKRASRYYNQFIRMDTAEFNDRMKMACKPVT